MKLGLFGGTFNPIHFGHISVAIAVQSWFSFDHIYFIPSRKPPHKKDKSLVLATNRCEMISRSLPRSESFSLSRVELGRNGPSYSVDTVRYFKSKFSNQDMFFFVLGIDAFLEFHTWESYLEIIELVGLIVVSRSAIRSSRYFNDLDMMKEFIFSKISSNYRFSAKNLSWQHQTMKPIQYFRGNFPDISSSLIRHSVKSGKSLSSFVPSAVADYIKGEGLYL